MNRNEAAVFLTGNPEAKAPEFLTLKELVQRFLARGSDHELTLEEQLVAFGYYLERYMFRHLEK